MRNDVDTKEWIAVVSGLPRSGTSMMMRMLESGGMQVLVDHVRKPDEDNPKGYYEFEQVKKIKEDSSWIESTHGKVFKMVSGLLYDLPKGRKYKIIFMRRDMKEMLASQKVMLRRNGRAGTGPDDEEMGRLFAWHLDAIVGWLGKQRNMDILYVNYNSVLRDPRENAERINRFLGNTLNIERTITAVDETLYRNRCVA